MNFLFLGKKDVVSEALKQMTREKMEKLSKILPENTDIKVTYKVTNFDNEIKVNFTAFNKKLRAEAKSKDMYEAIDKVVDIMQKQLRRLKGRIRVSSQAGGELAKVQSMTNDISDNQEIVINYKEFFIDYFTAEDAIMEMELTNRDFFLFRNKTTDQINVVYKTKQDNKYGVIEPV